MSRVALRLLASAMAAAATFALGASTASSATWYVSPLGSDVNRGDRTTKPFLTLAKAVSSVASGDTIKVAEGTYRESIVLPNLAALTIQGGWDARFSSQDPATRVTSLVGDGTSTDIGFALPAGAATLDGLRIAGYYNGVYLPVNAESNAITCSRCTFDGNGAAAMVYSGTLTITDSQLINNWDRAIYTVYSSPGYRKQLVLTGNVFANNPTPVWAVGPTLYPNRWLIANNIFVNNAGYSQIYISGYVSMVDVFNNTLIGTGFGIGINMGVYSSAVLTNNIITNFETGVGQGGAGGNAVMATNSLYGNVENYGLNITPGATDYAYDCLLDDTGHLTEGSPCADLGTDLSPRVVDDFDGDLRVPPGGDGRFDIGADELTAATACTDLDVDGYFFEAGCGTPVDCDDSQPLANPGLNEKGGRSKDGIDNDCNGVIDG